MTRTLGGRYELTELIARGGMGSVYTATDQRLHRTVAVKLLKEELAQDPRFIERFRREARAAAGLSHGNIARVFDYGVDDGNHFIVMELAEGRDLARLLRVDGALEPQRARAMAAQIAAALGHAHEIDLIHRDVKPANIIVSDEDKVKVTDFGIARASGDSTLTATGSVLGTAQYLAPEQASGEPVTPATDVYALGIVLYEMLTGSLPFTGGSAVEVAMRHLNDDVPLPSSLKQDMPRDLDEVVERATSKDPARRFATGTEMAAALTGRGVPATVALAGAGATATRPLPVAEDRMTPRRLGRMVLMVLAGLIALAGLLAIVRIAGQPPDTAAEEPRNGTQQQPGADAEEEPEVDPIPQAYVIPADVVGMRYEDIAREIEQSGLGIEVRREERDAPEPRDVILESNPEPGSRVEAGETITLIVSSGNSPDDDDDDDNSGPGRGRGRGRGGGQGSDDD